MTNWKIIDMDDFTKIAELKHARTVVNVPPKPAMAMPDESVSPEPKPPFTERMLELDPNFAAAARHVHILMEGTPLEGDNIAATRYGIDVMTEFNFNFAGPAGIPGESGVSSPGMIVQAAKLLGGGTEDQAKSFVYLLDQYDRLPMFTMKGSVRAIRSMVSDPTVIAGITGVGMFGRETAKQTAKTGIRKALVALARNPAKTAGAVVGAETGLTEKAIIEAERKAGYDISPEEERLRLGLSTTIGAGFGLGLTGLGTAVAREAAPAIAKSIDEAGEGARARIAAREADTGVTLGAGVDPMPMIDEAIAKVVAPKENKPGIIAFHGSGADFDEFKVDKIGTGEGAQAYGYGLYFTDSEDIAKYYRNAVTGMDRYNEPDLDTQAGGLTEELGFDAVGGTHSLSSADPDYDYYIGELDKFAVNKSENLSENSKTWEFADGSELTLQTEDVMTFNGKPLDSVYTRDVEDRFGVDIKRIAEEAKNFGIRDDVGTLEDDIGMIFSNLGQGLSNKRDAKTAVESLAGPSGPGAPSRYETIYKYFIEPKIDMTRVDYLMNAGQKKGKMYKVGLEPKPEDMLDFDLPLSQQPNAIQEKAKSVLNLLYPDVENPALSMKGRDLIDQLKQRVDVSVRNEMTQQRFIIDNKIEPALADKNRDALDRLVLSKVQQGANLNTQNADKISSEIMQDFGIPGIKYRAAGSRGAGIDDAAAERNYVIFDDKMIKILEKYGIVGPVSIAAMNAGGSDESEAM